MNQRLSLSVEAQSLPFDGQAAAVAIGRLRALLENSDGDAEEAFRSLQLAVGSAVEKPQLAALGASINDFDFDAALLKLNAVSELCKKTEDQLQ